MLLLRHFGRGQVAQEEKDAPLLFVLKNLAGRRAEFVEEQVAHSHAGEDLGEARRPLPGGEPRVDGVGEPGHPR